MELTTTGGLPRGRYDRLSRAEYQNSTCDIDLFFQLNGFQSSLVEQLASDPNLLPYFRKTHCQNTAKLGLELFYRLFYGGSRRFYEIRQKEQKIERDLENNGKARRGVLSLHPYNDDKTIPNRCDSDT